MKRVLNFGMAFLATCTLFTNCSTNENNDLESLKTIGEEMSAKTSGGTCSSTVNFRDLIEETSWTTGDTSDKDEFDACGVDGDTWMDKYSDGTVMMKCLSGDGHRTEMKEESGDEKALNNYKKIKYIAKFTNLPENGVTIAQIHNRGTNVKRPFVRLYIDDDRYIKIKETKSCITCSSSSDAKYDTWESGIKYVSSAEITVNFWTGLSGQSKGKFTVSTGGKSWAKTVWPDSQWKGSAFVNDFYLKAGVYSEGNDKTATVKYSYFSINH